MLAGRHKRKTMTDKMATDKTMRRSRRIATTLLTAAAAATLSGCSHNTTTARCIGPDGRVLSDVACQGGAGGGVYYRGGGYGGSGGYGGGYARQQPRWVYGGSGGTAIGSRATGYSTTAPSEGDITTHSGTTIRGGFGGEGSSHGAGEGGEGGGHGGGGGE